MSNERADLPLLPASQRPRASWESGARGRRWPAAVQHVLGAGRGRYDRRPARYLAVAPTGRAAFEATEVPA
jgi:hypothetical protein